MRADAAALIIRVRLEEAGLQATEAQLAHVMIGVLGLLEESRTRAVSERNRANYVRRQKTQLLEVLREARGALEAFTAADLDAASAPLEQVIAILAPHVEGS